MSREAENQKLSDGGNNVEYGTNHALKELEGNSEATEGRATNCAVLVYFLAIGEGYDFGVFAAVLVLLLEDFSVSSWTLGLLGACHFIGMIVGAPSVGFVADVIGRKLALCCACLFLVAGSLIIGLAPSIPVVLTGRIVMGVGFGLGIPLGGLYIVEVAPSEKRGTLGAGFGACLAVGTALGSAAGALLQDTWNDWRVMTLIGAAMPCICMVALMHPWFPESPRWLTSRGESQKACEALEALNGIDREAALLLQQRIEAELRDGDVKDNLTAFTQVLRPAAEMRPRIMLAMAVPMCMFLCAFVSVVIYLPVLLKEFFSRRFAVTAAGAIAGTCALLGGLAVRLPDVVGRRPLLVLGYAGICFGFLMLSVAMSPYGFSKGTSFLGWWTIFWFAFSWLCFQTAVAPVTLFYPGEILSSELRAMGMGIGNTIARLVGFCATLLFPVLIAYSVWLTYGIAMISNVLITVFMLAYAVETKGLNLEEVAAIYAGTDSSRAG